MYLPRYFVASPSAAAASGGGGGDEEKGIEEEEAVGGWYDVSTHLAYDEADGRFRIRGGAPLLEGGQVGGWI